MLTHTPISEKSRPIVEKIITVSGGTSNEPPDGNVDIALGRLGLEKLAEMGQLKENVSVNSIDMNGIPGESIIPCGCDANRVVLFLHGGAYLFGSLNTHRQLAAVIAEHVNAQAVTPAYRLAPEHPFPAAIEDALISYDWLLQHRVPSQQIILSGDSAGGGLALALLLSLLAEKRPLPAAVVLLSPWTKLDATTEDLIDRYKGPDVTRNDLRFKATIYANGQALSDPLISPIYGDFTGAPPVLIQVGGHERLREDSTELYDLLIAQGVDARLEIWDGLFHVFQAFPSVLPESIQALDRIGDFTKQQFK